MKALILNSRVIQVEQQQFPVAQPLYWLDCPENCQAGWAYTNNEFLPPPQPTPEEIQEQINQEAHAYLASTDWYVVRASETGTPIPQDILNSRQAARERIV